MAAVFPESMDKLNHKNAEGSFAIIENYIRYMVERIEFSVRGVTRNVSSAGVSNVEIAIRLEEIANAVSSVASEINVIKGQITDLQSRVETLESKQGV